MFSLHAVTLEDRFDVAVSAGAFAKGLPNEVAQIHKSVDYVKTANLWGQFLHSYIMAPGRWLRHRRMVGTMNMLTSSLSAKDQRNRDNSAEEKPNLSFYSTSNTVVQGCTVNIL